MKKVLFLIGIIIVSFLCLIGIAVVDYLIFTRYAKLATEIPTIAGFVTFTIVVFCGIGICFASSKIESEL